MKSQWGWLLLVSFLLVCGMIGCGEMPQIEAGKPKASEMLAAADEDYRSRAYIQAIDEYERYRKIADEYTGSV